MQISLTIVGLLTKTNVTSPIDAFVSNLAEMRDEGFRRVWTAQLPFDPDLLTMLAVAFREVDTIRIGSGCCPSRFSTRPSWHSAHSRSIRSRASASLSASG
jgi:hypothetical protein